MHIISQGKNRDESNVNLFEKDYTEIIEVLKADNETSKVSQLKKKPSVED